MFFSYHFCFENYVLSFFFFFDGSWFCFSDSLLDSFFFSFSDIQKNYAMSYWGLIWFKIYVCYIWYINFVCYYSKYSFFQSIYYATLYPFWAFRFFCSPFICWFRYWYDLLELYNDWQNENEEDDDALDTLESIYLCIPDIILLIIFIRLDPWSIIPVGAFVFVIMELIELWEDEYLAESDLFEETHIYIPILIFYIWAHQQTEFSVLLFIILYIYYCYYWESIVDLFEQGYDLFVNITEQDYWDYWRQFYIEQEIFKYTPIIDAETDEPFLVMEEDFSSIDDSILAWEEMDMEEEVDFPLYFSLGDLEQAEELRENQKFGFKWLVFGLSAHQQQQDYDDDELTLYRWNLAKALEQREYKERYYQYLYTYFVCDEYYTEYDWSRNQYEINKSIQDNLVFTGFYPKDPINSTVNVIKVDRWESQRQEWEKRVALMNEKGLW